MKALLQILLTMVAWGAGVTPRNRRMTYDVANQTSIKYRMNAGFAGDVNRTHPFSVEPALNDDVAPATAYGQPVVIDATGNAVRRIGVADASDGVSLMAWGFTVRPFPTQQSTGGMTASFGTGTPPAGVIDVAKQAYIIATLNDPTETPVKGGAVYVWCAASAGAQVQGGITTTASAGNTVKLANAVFNGAGDAAGNVEVIVGDRRSL